MADDLKKASGLLIVGLDDKTKFAALKEENQKQLLDSANGMIAAIDERGEKDAAAKTNLTTERARLVALIAQDKPIYEATSKKTYSFNLSEFHGSETGQKFTKFMDDIGTDIGTGIKHFGEWVSGLWSSKKTDDKAPGTSASATTGTNTTTPPATEELGDDGKPLTIWGKIKKFFSEHLGDTIGGVAGGLGGWFLGNLFGGGIIGKIAGALLACGGFFLGQKTLGKTIDHMMGRPNSKDTPAEKAAHAQQPGQGQMLGHLPTQNQSPITATSFTPEEMQVLQQSYLEKSAAAKQEVMNHPNLMAAAVTPGDYAPTPGFTPGRAQTGNYRQ